MSAFVTRNLVPVLGAEVHGHEFAAASVAAGRGYALCVVPSVIRLDEELVLRPLLEDVPALEVSLLARRADPDLAVADLRIIAGDISGGRSR